MKKLIKPALAIALTLSFTISAAAYDRVSPFADVAADSWYCRYSTDTYDKGIMAGISDTTFAPDLMLTRGMAASLIYRMYGSPEVKYSNRFSDISNNEWYTDGIMWAEESGIMTGYTDGTFCPDWSITVEQLASVLYRLAGCPNVSADAHVLDGYKDDFLISSYAKDAVIWAVSNGMLYGTTLHPTSAVTRAEASKMLSVYTTVYDYGIISTTGDISDYIRKYYDSTFDFTKYDFVRDGDDICLYYVVDGYVSTFGYRAVMSGDKLLRVEMIGKMNPYLLSTNPKAPDITDDELYAMALENADDKLIVLSQNIRRYFDMDSMKFVFEVSTVYTDKNGEEATELYRYEV
ncbi:MAG: S-layer homology domain-containing protein [Clostridia bacterium]|nr:S-layer homology domain-containing protein [Clostridia bacterium]